MKSTPSILAVALGGSAFAAGASAPTPPAYATCSSEVTYVRPASEGLSPGESNWLDSRRPQVVSALESYLTLAAIPGFDVSTYVSTLSANDSAVPVIGQAYSGGGTRATVTFIAPLSPPVTEVRRLDGRDRYSKSVDAKTGGLSQATTYVAGHVPNSAYELLQLKANAGFNLSIADVMGIAEVFYPAKGVIGSTFGGLLSSAAYTNGSVTLPFLIMAEGIPQGLTGSNSYDGILFPINNATNQTIYEISPIEFGSWQGRAQAFTPTSLLGTPLRAGVPVNESECVTGWDSSPWVFGAATAAEADWVVIVDTNNTLGIFSRAESRQKRQELAYPPNETELMAESQVKELGAFITGILPAVLGLLGNATIQATTSRRRAFKNKRNWHWPGKSYLATYPASEKNGLLTLNTAAIAIANNVPFPKLPDVNTFLINNYTLAPVFFGCSTNLSNSTGPSEAQIQLLLQNTLYVVAQSNTTWAQCIPERLGQAIPDQCTLCFERHCWQGEMVTGTPPFVAPPLLLSPNITFDEWNATTWQPAFSETGTVSNAFTPPSSGSDNAAGGRIIRIKSLRGLQYEKLHLAPTPGCTGNLLMAHFSVVSTGLGLTELAGVFAIGAKRQYFWKGWEAATWPTNLLYMLN
ncbi:FabD/lysophospholipase-like protein [Mycena olivaceomarginata]|nr:FabD/lysophospholipase-like protein [Mycena olivaceomarginata]